MTKPKSKNNLLVVRRRFGFTRKQVAHLLGYTTPTSIARIEQGNRRPDLVTALSFEILYRTPVAYLYAPLYAELRDQLRAKEAALKPAPAEDTSAALEGGEHA